MTEKGKNVFDEVGKIMKKDDGKNPGAAPGASPGAAPGAAPAAGGTPKTYVLMVLDDSVSMQDIRAKAIEMFNEQVKTIKAMGAGQNIRVGALRFSSHVKEPWIWDADTSKLDELTEATYNPQGSSTCLLDGIGIGIAKLKDFSDINDPNVAVLFQVVTDGLENSSREFDHEKIMELIKECEKTERWTFTFLGASLESIAEAKKLGFGAGNVAMGVGTKSANVRAAAGTASYLSGRACGQSVASAFYSQSDSLSDEEVEENLKKMRGEE